MTLRRVLVEISVTEQRYQAVLDVRAGSTVTDVAARFGCPGKPCIAGELLDDHRLFVSVADAQHAIDAFRLDYNTNRPHQSLDMAFPTDRFKPLPGDGISLKLPPPLVSGAGENHGVLHLLDTDRTLLRSLPNPLTNREISRIRDARPAGPAPTPATGLLRVDRRVSCRGSIMIARQKIQVGIGHAGQTVTVEEADTTFRVYHGDQLLAEVIRATTKQVARFKVRKPEPPRRVGG